MNDREELLETANAVRLAVGVLSRRVRYDGISGASPSETMVLSRLDRYGPETIASLARHEGVTPQAIGATVAALESRGLLTRAPDPDDGRRALLSPTPSGLELIRNARNAVSERIAGTLADHFSDEEISAIRTAAPLIERLAHLL